ncbi:hypothetical protein CS022_11160 [Veronia nyctiphanis]|uniref:Uncharacterized protein n=1 Tax=Veronia nyctiphanis TaxID=1278244 RepID=A0A4Q0YQA1_9GAMM|nr:hypothetical protein CS022_11160 [Veronia nyctiphanis]
MEVSKLACFLVSYSQYDHGCGLNVNRGNENKNEKASSTNKDMNMLNEKRKQQLTGLFILLAGLLSGLTIAMWDLI